MFSCTVHQWNLLPNSFDDTLPGFKNPRRAKQLVVNFNKELFTKIGIFHEWNGSFRKWKVLFRLWVGKVHFSTLEGILSEQLTEIIEQFFWKVLHKFNWSKNDNETLTSSITQSTQQTRKGRTQGEDPSQSHKSKTQNGSQRGNGTKLFSRAPSAILAAPRWHW
jgi:hypothetical protein